MFIGKQTTTILFCLTVGLSELYAVNLTQSEGLPYLLGPIQKYTVCVNSSQHSCCVISMGI